MQLSLHLILFIVALGLSTSSSSSSNGALPVCPIDNWEKISTTKMATSSPSTDVDIITYTRKNNGSALLSFRGDALRVPIHISEAVSHFQVRETVIQHLSLPEVLLRFPLYFL